MTLKLEKLDEETIAWLDDRARSHGWSLDLEAQVVLAEAVRERMRREKLFQTAAANRLRVAGPPLTTEEIEEMIDWGRT